MSIELPASVRPLFVAAGWQPAREVPVPALVPAEHPARNILAAFSGLIVAPTEEMGERCVSSQLEFGFLDPTIYSPGGWDVLLATHLVGVAAVEDGHGYLYVAADGRCFERSNVHDGFWFYGANFSEAMEGLLLGRTPRPMLRPNEESVMFNGLTYTRRNAWVYRYEGDTRPTPLGTGKSGSG